MLKAPGGQVERDSKVKGAKYFIDSLEPPGCGVYRVGENVPRGKLGGYREGVWSKDRQGLNSAWSADPGF